MTWTPRKTFSGLDLRQRQPVQIDRKLRKKEKTGRYKSSQSDARKVAAPAGVLAARSQSRAVYVRPSTGKGMIEL